MAVQDGTENGVATFSGPSSLEKLLKRSVTEYRINFLQHHCTMTEGQPKILP